MMQFVELHYKRRPMCDFAAVKARAQEILGSELHCSEPTKGDQAFLIFHKNHRFPFQDGQVPAQTAILAMDQPPKIEKYQKVIQQSWRCVDPEDLLRSCTENRLVTEMMARFLPPKDRVVLFHGALQAMIEVTHPDALVFQHSQEVIEPAVYLKSCDKEPILRPGSLNVRFFRISDSDGEMLMDTRGLTEIGLHDFQCHFRDLDPTEVARVLLDTAVYVFQNGPVIESGQTVAGFQPESKWLCQFENALVEPEREVLDLNHGEPYAAGKREG